MELVVYYAKVIAVAVLTLLVTVFPLMVHHDGIKRASKAFVFSVGLLIVVVSVAAFLSRLFF